jgi:multiple sugar transport system substrate-binding protein
MKRLLLSLALVGGLLVSAPPAMAQEDLTFANWFYEGELKDAFEKYRISFEEAHPEVGTVQIQTTPFPKYLDTLNVRLASGSPPDVAWIHAGHGPAFIAADRLVDLTPYIEKDPSFNLADFGDAMKPWTKDGKIYGIPFTNAGNVLYYNADLFAKAGVPTPRELLDKGEWTWEKLREISRDLVAKGGARYGYLFGNNIFTVGWQNLVDIIPSYGGAPWSADGKTCMFNDPKTLQALQLVHDMIYVDKTHPEPGVDADFAAGDIGMSLTRPNFAFRLNDATFKWDVVPAPSGPEGYVPSRAQNAIGVFKGAKHEALGAEYVVWMTNPKNGALWTASASPRASLQSLDILKTNNKLDADQLQRAVIPAMTSAKFQLEYTHRNYGPLTAEVQRLFGGLIWTPDVDLKEATTDLCNQIGPMLQ